MTYPPQPTPNPGHDPQASRRASTLRASDSEREAAATSLRDHCAAGRLNPDELTQRLDLVYAAKTSGELETLFDDLPTPPASDTRTSRPHLRWTPTRLVAVPILSASAALAAATDPHLLWLAWPALAIAGRRRRFGRTWHTTHG